MTEFTEEEKEIMNGFLNDVETAILNGINKCEKGSELEEIMKGIHEDFLNTFTKEKINESEDEILGF